MKKTVRQIIVTFFLAMSYVSPMSAQAIEENVMVRDCLDSIFANIDKTRVPTGLLRDYAFTLVDFDKYDGQELTDSNYVTKGVFEYILRSVRSAAVLQKPFEPVTDIMNKMYERGKDNAIVCGLALYKYNYVKENALGDNLIRYEDERAYDVYDGSGNWMNPYDEKYIIGFSSYSIAARSGTVELSFPDEFIFTNTDISRIELDAGQGYQTVGIGNSISIQLNNNSEQELKLRVTLASGRTLLCHSVLLSSDGFVSIPSSANPSGESTIRTPDLIQTFEKGTVAASASVFYADNNTQRKVCKPFIVVEGFDPLYLKDYEGNFGFYEDSEFFFYRDYGYTHAGNMLFSKDTTGTYYSDIGLLLADYDIIYIDWDNSEADIRTNAELLISVIDWINNEKHANGSTEDNALMGQSMGGLIARYALRKMEIDCHNHEVTTFISHDVPHLGANIPLGALYGAHSILSFIHGGVAGIDLAKKFNMTEGVRLLKKYLYSDSAKQMLVNYVNERGQLDNTVHERWQNELGTLGFPEGDGDKGILNLAITNGGEWDYSSIAHYAKVSGYVNSNLANLILGILAPLGIAIGFNPKIPFSAKISPYFNHGAQVFKMNVDFRTKILFFIPLNIPLFSSTKYAPNTGLIYETFPGSTYWIPQDYNGNADKGNFTLKYHYQIDLAERFMFIPNASALCIGNGTRTLSESDYVSPYWLNPPKPLVDMPFHAVYSSNKATDHIATFGNMYEWIRQQIEVKVEGPSMPVSGDVYTLENCTSSVTWTTGDESIATINRYSGEIMVNNPGVTTVNACYYYNGNEYSRSKTIMVGLPDFYLKNNNDNYNYSVTAKCRTDSKAFQLFVDEGLIEYEWGIKKENEPIEWTVQRDSVFAIVPFTNQAFTVYMRVKCNNGMRGPVYSMVLETTYPYSFNPKFIVSNADGELYLCANHTIGLMSSEPQPLVLNIRRVRALEQQGVNLEMPHHIVINDEMVRYWYEYPGGVDFLSTGVNFYLLYEDEFTEYKNRMKPWGDSEIIILSVRVQSNASRDLQVAPVIMMYIEDFPKDYSEGIMMEMYGKY